jgi:UDP-N-acetylmuramate: L-alanyl-gamma-D-glutamyl-meso-diaminopimelate ligase
MHPEKVVAALVHAGHDATFFPDADAIVQGLTPRLKPGDVVAILSNGGFDGIYEKLPSTLEKR